MELKSENMIGSELLGHDPRIIDVDAVQAELNAKGVAIEYGGIQIRVLPTAIEDAKAYVAELKPYQFPGVCRRVKQALDDHVRHYEKDWRKGKMPPSDAMDDFANDLILWHALTENSERIAFTAAEKEQVARAGHRHMLDLAKQATDEQMSNCIAMQGALIGVAAFAKECARQAGHTVSNEDVIRDLHDMLIYAVHAAPTRKAEQA
jgi:hypothetical protein